MRWPLWGLIAALAALQLAGPPSVGALEGVQVGEGAAKLRLRVDGHDAGNNLVHIIRQESSTAASYSQSFSESTECGSATASQSSATVNGEAPFSISYDGTVRASTPPPRPPDEVDPPPDCPPGLHGGDGESEFARRFELSVPMQFRLEIDIDRTTSGSGLHNGFVRAVRESFGEGIHTGTLDPGSYSVSLLDRCFAGVEGDQVPGSCDSRVRVFLELRPSTQAQVAIGSGPSGLVASRDARFEFTTIDPNPPAGQFQCRIDGQPDFTTCSSPVTLSNLSDGEHAFRVRYDADGADPPSTATERTWTVDGTQPTVVFDSAPAGSDNPPNAQIAFHSTEPEGATFRCQLDGGAAFDCSSPHSLSDLAAGPHSFSVTTTDRAGNESLPASVGWTVSGPAAPVQLDCEAGSASAGFGPVRLIARAVDACFVDETFDGRPAKVSRGQVSLNGITLTPAPGTRIIVAPGLEDGSVRVDGPVTVVFGSPPRPGENPLSLTLDGLALPALGFSGAAVTKSISFGENALSDVAGLKALPVIQLELKPDNGGQVTTTFKLKLPKVAFRQLPGRDESQVEGVTVEFAPTFSNDNGVSFGGRIKLGHVFLFGQKVKDLDLAYDHATGAFDGSFGLEYGPKRFGIDPTLTFALTIAPTASECGLRKLGIQASNLNKHIGSGVFLQRYGGTFECALEGGNRFAKLVANAGVSAGPRVALGPLGEVEAISVDGTATLTIPVGPQPPELFSFEVKGTGKIVDIPVSEQTITYKAPATIKATGKLDFTAGGYGAQLTYGEGSFISEGLFNIEAAGTANVFGFEFGAEAVYSTTGFAVCFGEPGDKVGFGKRWLGGELTAFVACDVGPFRAAAPARAAQAGARRFTIGEDRPLTVAAAEGDSEPPKVVVAGPNGVRVETPNGAGGISRKDLLLIQDPDRDTTFVVLFNPPAGRWSIETVGGSSTLRSLRLARGLPRLTIAAKVTGRGTRRVLSWKAKGLAAQRLELVERGSGSARALTSTTRASGTLRFRPDPRLGRQRAIEAIAYNRGIPRSSTTVARYRVAQPPTPKRVRGLKLKKRTLTWSGQRGVNRYELGLTLPDGTTRSVTARRARFKLSGMPRRGRVKVSIVAVNALGKAGPVASSKFKLR